MNGIKLTVYFDDVFWVGLFERLENTTLSVCKITFGAEPKDCELWDFILKHYFDLKFSKALKTEQKISADNPKRRLRNIKKQMKTTATSTKAQQAIAAQKKEFKKDKQTDNKQKRETEKKRKFELLRKKRKEKHRGR